MPSGDLQAADAVHLPRADGGALPTQTWPLAYWPDGSIKWLGCTAVVGPDGSEHFSLVAGPGPAPATPLRITQPGIEIIRVVGTGTMIVEVGDRGRYLIQEIARDGRLAAGGAELVWLRCRHRFPTAWRCRPLTARMAELEQGGFGKAALGRQRVPITCPWSYPGHIGFLRESVVSASRGEIFPCFLGRKGRGPG